VPVLGWLLLRGRCRDCRAPISRRYPLVEAGTALLCVLVVLVKGIEPEALLGIVFVLLLVPITLIDLDHGIIPNKLTLLGSVLGFALVALFFTDDLVEHIVAAALAGGFLLIAAFVYPSGMGMGDVKLAFVMGLFLGRAVAPAMFVAFFAGSVVGVAIMARYGAEARKRTIPFGPWLAFGGAVGLLVGDEIVDWYLGTFT
jgi:leader peptidase (prepilin peptidase)/N-methyltransferase